jgi:hypothetical protein
MKIIIKYYTDRALNFYDQNNIKEREFWVFRSGKAEDSIILGYDAALMG